MSEPLIAKVFDAAYWLPVGLGSVLMFRRRLTVQQTYVVLALAISILASAIQEPFQQIGLNNWFVEYLYPAPQLILCLMALMREDDYEAVAAIATALAIGTLAVIVRGEVRGPETAVQVIGSVFVVWFAYERWQGRYPVDGSARWLPWSMFVYWGATAPLVLTMPLVTSVHALWALWLEMIFGIRIVALGMITYWMWRTRQEPGVRLV